MTSSNELLKSEKFWQILKYLCALNAKEDIEKIQSDLEIPQNILFLYISFLKDVGMPLEIYDDGKSKVLELQKPHQEIEVKFSLLEWLSFQATFPKLSELSDEPLFASIQNKLLSLEEQNKSHDLFPALEVLSEKSEAFKPVSVGADGALQGQIVSFIEEAIYDHNVIRVNLNNSTSLKVYPRKVVFLDGQLSVVAEGIDDKCMINLSLVQITSVHEEEHEWTPLFSALEIDDFLASLRAITENEIRLVLKVYSREKFNTELKHHHFGSQCMFTNPEGDHIWAATIEPSEEVLSWLSELGKDVEVLDPMSIKKDLLKYCEDKLKKIA